MKIKDSPNETTHKNDTHKSKTLKTLTEEFLREEARLREGGDKSGKERQTRLGRMTVRERLENLLDRNKPFFELGLWAGYKMYSEWGELPAAGVVTILGSVCCRPCMVIANDATVKAGAFFPQSVKKVLRAQRIAFECRLPIIYLVDSSGVFLPLQEDIFPDEDDFGRIFRNNAVLSAAGIPQIAAIMGNCIAGGGYLPVLCDKLLMTEGSGLYLAGPALVKAAIGQEVDPEELGGGKMHFEVSGTVDFLEPNDNSCLNRIRSLIDLYPGNEKCDENPSPEPENSIDHLYDIVSADGKTAYDVRHLLQCIVDKNSFIEFKAGYGQTLVTGCAKLDGIPVGIIANQRMATKTGSGEIEIGGVIYSDAADKAARFIMDCNQTKLPLLFLQDVMGFMVGKEAEQSGIIRKGAKLVSAISNSIVPKITIIIGNSFGAGHYALCGKAYDPNFILAWPSAKYAVMGSDQAANTLFTVQERAAERRGEHWNKREIEKIREKVKEKYDEQTNIRYGAARGWIDAIIAPSETRNVLIYLLGLVKRAPITPRTFHTGVFQV